MALAEHAVALRMFYRRDICIPVFLALNKVGVGQYEDSDFKLSPNTLKSPLNWLKFTKKSWGQAFFRSWIRHCL